ncbi:BRO family protein [Streptomyces purpureus]|uniref:BRO family protein n=1 Tax=Streptomyces purpureus TaxID=1951 RepID=UPI0037A09428
MTINSEPWWVARDVLDVLGLGNALARLDEDEKSSIRLTDGTPGNPNRAVINEPGLRRAASPRRR